MGFNKGESGNLKGRPKGAKNRSTTNLREKVHALLDDQFEQIVKDLAGLEPKERINVYVRLLEYSLPKLQRTETTFDLSKLSEEEIDRLFQQALQSM